MSYNFMSCICISYIFSVFYRDIDRKRGERGGDLT